MGPLPEIDRDLALVAVLALGIKESDAIAGQRPARASGLEPLARRIADQGRRFRLAIAVADLDIPGSADGLDELGVERLAGTRCRPQPHREGFQILLDQKSPHCGRRAERRNAMPGDDAERVLGIEAGAGMDENRGRRVPGREETAPGMLGPARRADVEVNVARTKAEPARRGGGANRALDRR